MLASTRDLSAESDVEPYRAVLAAVKVMMAACVVGVELFHIPC